VTTLVVLPHADPTLCPEAPEHPTLPLHVAAVDRLAGPGSRPAINRAVAGPIGEAEAALAAAAYRVLDGEPGPAARWIATDVVLTLRSRHESWPIHLRLDDLELIDGSTESTADLRRAADRPGPFEPELARALSEPAAVLWIERDQQLPALFALAACSDTALRLDGPFARRHWTALRPTLPDGSLLVDTGAVPMVAGHRVSWQHRGPDLPWADQLGGTELVAAARTPPPRCAVAILPIALADEERIVHADGTVVGHHALRAAVDTLVAAGARVLVEFWLGAPEVTETELHDTARVLAAADLPWRVVGCRPFHAGPVAITTWAGRPVTALPTPGSADLARSTRSRGVPSERVVQSVGATLAARHSPVPARVAGAYLDELVPADGPPRLAPGVLVVPVDGKHLLVDLRARRTYVIDDRFGARLARLPGEAALAGALPPGRAMERTVGLLSSVGALAGAEEARADG